MHVQIRHLIAFVTVLIAVVVVLILLRNQDFPHSSAAPTIIPPSDYPSANARLDLEIACLRQGDVINSAWFSCPYDTTRLWCKQKALNLPLVITKTGSATLWWSLDPPSTDIERFHNTTGNSGPHFWIQTSRRGGAYWLNVLTVDHWSNGPAWDDLCS